MFHRSVFPQCCLAGSLHGYFSSVSRRLCFVILSPHGSHYSYPSKRRDCFCQTPLQLANPTQLQLVGVGVDFVYPRKKKEGRRRKEPPPSFKQKECPYISELWCVSCGCLEGVWNLSGGCLAVVQWLSRGCLKSVWKVPGMCLKGVWRVSMGCPKGNLECKDW